MYNVRTIQFYILLSHVLCTIVIIWFTSIYVINLKYIFSFALKNQVSLKNFFKKQEKRGLIFINLYPISTCLPSFVLIHISILYCIPSAWRTSFTISWGEGLLVTYSLKCWKKGQPVILYLAKVTCKFKAI